MYYFLLVFHCKYICFLHRLRDINTYLSKNEDVTWPRPRPSKGQFVIAKQALLGQIRAQNLTILSLAIPEKFKGMQNSKMDHVILVTPFQGRVGRPLTLDIAYNHAKFNVSSFSRSRDISGGVKF